MAISWEEMEDRMRRARERRERQAARDKATLESMQRDDDERRQREQAVKDMYRNYFPDLTETGKPKGNATMVDNIGEALGAVEGIGSHLMDVINELGAVHQYIEEQAAETSALETGLGTAIGTVANEGIAIEHDLIILQDVKNFLEEKLGQASAAGLPTGALAHALAACHELDDKIRGTLHDTSLLGTALSPPKSAAESLARTLAADAEQTERLQARASDTRHETEATAQAIAQAGE